MDMEFCYIGTGAYLTPAPDESGSGNHLANTGAIPGVENGRQVLLFNGTNSKLAATEPKTDEAFSILFEWKRTTASLGVSAILLGDRTATTGWYFSFETDNILYFNRYVSGIGWVAVALGAAVTDVTNPFVYGVVLNSTNYYTVYKGTMSTGTAGIVSASEGLFEIGHDTVASSYAKGKLLGLYLTEDTLTQAQITDLVTNGLPEPFFIYEDYYPKNEALFLLPSHKTQGITVKDTLVDADGNLLALGTNGALLESKEHHEKLDRFLDPDSTFYSLERGANTMSLASTGGVFQGTMKYKKRYLGA
jgi:hypothetical protein